VERAGLINDVITIARTGRVSYDIALPFLNHLRDENKLVIWNAALIELQYLNYMLMGENCYRQFQNFTHWLIENAIDTLGFYPIPNESRTSSELRIRILTIALYLSEKRAVAFARTQYENEFLIGNSTIPNDILSPILSSVIYNGGYVEFNTVLQRYYNEHNSLEKKRYLYSLGSTKLIYLLEELLQMILDSNKIRPEDRIVVISSVSANPLGKELAWDFVRENWHIFNIGGSYNPGNIIAAVAENFHSELRYREVEDFFKINKAQSSVSTVEQTLEKIRNNIYFVSHHVNDICNYLIKLY